jgi:hypothetical protein
MVFGLGIIFVLAIVENIRTKELATHSHVEDTDTQTPRHPDDTQTPRHIAGSHK